MKNLSLFNIKKWYKMILGKSILHIKQDVGKNYSISKVSGYYNDLTGKVLHDKFFDKFEIPKLEIENNRSVYFPISIFQYGLGAYDLYLISNKSAYWSKFMQMCDWALENQNENGSWNNFDFVYPTNPFSAMAQGEGASLLIRGYIETKETKFLHAAQKAIDFMIIPIEKGGTSYYVDDQIFFMEYTNKPVVLNGWIFAIFGLYDFTKVNRCPKYNEILQKSLLTLEKNLNKFDLHYWSSYNLDNSIITSKFYHDLHIAQLFALYNIFKYNEFQIYMIKWTVYSKKLINRSRAFIIKVFQKLFEH